MTSKVRHRRTKSEMPFADALSAATKRLVKAQREREQAQKSLTSLNAEIPNLQRTIAALESQLHPVAYSSKQIETLGTQMPIPNVPALSPEILALLPPDDLTGMGSTRAQDEDVLPDVEGQSLIED